MFNDDLKIYNIYNKSFNHDSTNVYKQYVKVVKQLLSLF